MTAPKKQSNCMLHRFSCCYKILPYVFPQHCPAESGSSKGSKSSKLTFLSVVLSLLASSISSKPLSAALNSSSKDRTTRPRGRGALCPALSPPGRHTPRVLCALNGVAGHASGSFRALGDAGGVPYTNSSSPARASIPSSIASFAPSSLASPARAFAPGLSNPLVSLAPSRLAATEIAAPPPSPSSALERRSPAFLARRTLVVFFPSSSPARSIRVRPPRRAPSPASPAGSAPASSSPPPSSPSSPRVASACASPRDHPFDASSPLASPHARAVVRSIA